ISSSRDIPSSAGTPRSHYEDTTERVINTPRSAHWLRTTPNSATAPPRIPTRSPRRGGQGRLADPPAFIPTFVLGNHFHQTSPLQARSRHLDCLSRQRGLPHQTKRRHI